MNQDANNRFRSLCDDIRRRTSLLDIMASDGIKFEPSGDAHKCLSPFRQERTPSFFVYSDNRWHDFGTSESGDVFAYVMRRDLCDFKEAVGRLAQRAGITPYWNDAGRESNSPVTLETLADIEDQIEREGTFDRLTEAAVYFHQGLPSKVREEYYKKVYGFTDETIDQWLLGFDTGGLRDHFLEDKKYSREACLRTGLFVRTGAMPSFFESRLVLPYWSGGKVVYMIGRRTEYTADVDYEKAKYKKLLTHSEKHPHVSKHVKNDWFWNEDVCRKPLKRLVITEGITDVIAAVQHGFDAISPVTVRFKNSQLDKLVKLCERVDTVYLCNDADVLDDGRRPGEEGAIATATALFRAGRDVRIVELPLPVGERKVDLCQFLRDNGSEPFEALLASAKKFALWVIDRIPEASLSEDNLDQKLAPVFDMLAACPSDIKREQYQKALAQKTKLSIPTIRKCMKEAQKRLPKADAKLSEAPVEEEVDASTTDDSAPDSTKPKSKTPSASAGGMKLLGEVVEDLFAYYIETPQGLDKRISSFVFRPKKVVEIDGQKRITADVETMTGQTIHNFTIAPGAWASRRDFMRAITGYPTMQWTGADDHVQGLLELLKVDEVPTTVGTKNLGYSENKGDARWVFADGVIDRNGIQSEPDVIYVPSGASMAHRLLYEQVDHEDFMRLARDVLPKLTEINSHDVTVPILSWFFATPFKPQIHKLIHHFPLLFVAGTQGSGKTSMLREIFWPLFGIAKKTDPYSCTETEFALVRLFSSTNSIPVMLDEFKPRDMGKNRVDRINRFLRRLYGGETEERGRADLSISAFELNAPVVIAGEMGPEDPAIVERSLLVQPNKNHLSSSEACKTTFHHLRQLPLHWIATEYLRWSFNQDVPAMIEHAREVVQDELKLANLKVEQRPFDNIMVMVFGLYMFDRWCQELGIETPEIDLQSLIKSVVGRILDGGSDGGSVKDSFDSFLEEISTYAHLGLLKEDTHYAYMGGKLCLHLRSCYEVYLAERKRTGRDDDTNGHRALLRIAKEKSGRNSYVTAVDRRVLMAKSYVRCIEVDKQLISDSLEIDFASEGTNRGWGGTRHTAWGDQGGDAE